MLLELCVRDFALIDRLTVSFGPGLNAITGETGAGKSLLVAALELLAGGKPRGGAASWVRAGAERAVVEGRFALPAPGTCLAGALGSWFDEHVPELAGAGGFADDGELVAVRALDTHGRSRARVQGHGVTVAALSQLVALFLEVHGQFEQRGVMEPARQLAWFDEIAERCVHGLPQVRDDYAVARRNWLAARARCEQFHTRRFERDGKEAFLKLTVEELSRLEPRRGEVIELRTEREFLRQSERIVGELGAAAALLSEGEEPIVAQLSAAVERVALWSALAPRVAGIADDLAAGLLHLEEAAAGLVSYLGGLEAEPARLEWTEQRLAEYERVARRHGAVSDGLADLFDQLQRERDELDDLDAVCSRAESEEAAALMALESTACGLDELRRAAIGGFESRVVPLLARLGLEGAHLSAVLHADTTNEPLRRFGPRGLGVLEFTWQPNPGEPARPLASIASGGEAARVFLALRCVAAGSGGDGGVGGRPASHFGAERTLLFDEVDAAVGGRLAGKVGECLAELGVGGQVLSVTHQPAIAARADRHLVVRKSVIEGRTRSEAVTLHGIERVDELAAMIAGADATSSSRVEARRMLAAAEAGGVCAAPRRMKSPVVGAAAVDGARSAESPAQAPRGRPRTARRRSA